jgi:hypothetical protein
VDLRRWLRSQWDRTFAVTAFVAGAVALFLGYRGVSEARLPAQQIPYLVSGGLVGMFVLGLGATFWLSADLRDEWRKLDDIYRRMGEQVPDRTPPPPEKSAVEPETNGHAARVAQSVGKASL